MSEVFSIPMSLRGIAPGPLAKALAIAGTMAGNGNSLRGKLRGTDLLPYKIIEFYPDATLVIDNEGTVLAWNKAMEDMTGVPAKDVIGRGDYEYALAFYGSRRPILIDLVGMPLDSVEAMYSEVRESNGKLEAVAESVRLKGSEVVLWGVSSKLYGTDGTAIGAIESIRDVTEQVRTERELKKAREELELRVEERTSELARAQGILQATLDTIPIGVVLANADNGLITYATKIARDIFNCEMAGINICNDERPYRLLNAKGVSLAPEERPLYRSLFHGEHISAEEIQVERADGSIMTTLVNSAPVSDKDGFIAAAVVCVMDITERKRAEKALLDSEERLRLCAAVAHLGTYDWDLLNDRHIWSPETYNIYGLSPGTPLTIDRLKGMIYPGDEREDLIAAGLDPAGSGEYTLEYRIIRASDGDVRWVYVKSRTIFHGQGAERHAFRVLGAIQDITDRKLAEETLRESEEKFRVLAETLASAVFIYQDNVLLYVNPALVKITGYSKEELRDMGYWGFIHPDHQEMVKQRGLDRLSGAPVPSRYEVKILTKSGEVRWLDIAAALIDYNGRPAGLMTAFDITERKQAEDALMEAKQQAELYLDLMGHDINNMNQIALGYLEMAEKTCDARTASVIAKALEMIHSITALIGNLRKIQRIRGGAYELERIDLGELLSRVVDEYSMMPGRNVHIACDIIAHGEVLANPLLKDVFSNIVGNAIKHSSGSLEVRVKVASVVRNERTFYEVAVEDNGPGIPDEAREKIFDRLERGRTGARGHGLGLYLVRTLVEGFHGRVWVEDRIAGDYSQGCRFVVLLPAAPDRAAEDKEA
jgi:PAS domain S-box-containing protein